MYEEALAKDLSNCLLKPTLVLSKIFLQKESESLEGLKVLYGPSEYDKAVDEFFTEKTNYLIKENGGKATFDPVTYLEWIIQSEFLEKIGEDYGEFTELFKFKELLKWYDEKRKLKFSIYYSTEKACSDYEVKIVGDKKPTTVILHFNVLKLNGTIETAAKILAFIQILKDRNIPSHNLRNEQVVVDEKPTGFPNQDNKPELSAIIIPKWTAESDILLNIFNKLRETEVSDKPAIVTTEENLITAINENFVNEKNLPLMGLEAGKHYDKIKMNCDVKAITEVFAYLTNALKDSKKNDSFYLRGRESSVKRIITSCFQPIPNEDTIRKYIQEINDDVKLNGLDNVIKGINKQRRKQNLISAVMKVLSS